MCVCVCVCVYVCCLFFINRLLRAAWRGWVAYVAELYRGLEAASMSAKYRALESINTWRYYMYIYSMYMYIYVYIHTYIYYNTGP